MFVITFFGNHPLDAGLMTPVAATILTELCFRECDSNGQRTLSNYV